MADSLGETHATLLDLSKTPHTSSQTVETTEAPGKAPSQGIPISQSHHPLNVSRASNLVPRLATRGGLFGYLGRLFRHARISRTNYILGTQHVRSMWSTKKRTRGRSFSDRRQTPDIISLDPAGDLILVVGSAEANNGPRCFLVSTDALRRVSRVWRSMLNHSSGWFAKTSTKQVTSLNDDPDSLLIVLNVAHIRFKELPSALGFAQIVQLALVCDAYDTVQVVRPFLPEWTRPYEHAILRAGYEEWLFVAYTFGYMEAFKSIAHHLTLHAAIDEDGRCINQNGRVMDGHFPPDIINNILQVRYKTIWKFLRCCYALVDEMIEGNTCVASKTLPAQAIAEWDRAEEASKCTHLMHGSMVRQLKSLNLWPPLKNSSSIQFSVHDLANTLKGISVLTWAKPRASWDVEGDTGHEKCNVSRKLARNIDEVLEKMESAVSDRHLEHMDEQALK